MRQGDAEDRARGGAELEGSCKEILRSSSQEAPCPHSSACRLSLSFPGKESKCLALRVCDRET